MNQVRYDGHDPGNDEPDFGMDVLRQRISEARSDVVDSRSNQLFTKPYVVRSMGGVEVGVLGIAHPNMPLATRGRMFPVTSFARPTRWPAEYVPRLRREGAELIVVLSHMGLSADRKLAEAVAGI